MIIMMVGCGADAYSNARKGAWGYFWLSLASTAFFAGVVGWLAIDAFNRRQRRRRAAQKPNRVPEEA
jgi:heme/copper-type cytochrome/quinol oxidase subunit 2